MASTDHPSSSAWRISVRRLRIVARFRCGACADFLNVVAMRSVSEASGSGRLMSLPLSCQTVSGYPEAVLRLLAALGVAEWWGRSFGVRYRVLPVIAFVGLQKLLLRVYVERPM